MAGKTESMRFRGCFHRLEDATDDWKSSGRPIIMQKPAGIAVECYFPERSMHGYIPDRNPIINLPKSGHQTTVNLNLISTIFFKISMNFHKFSGYKILPLNSPIFFEISINYPSIPKIFQFFQIQNSISKFSHIFWNFCNFPVYS